MNGSRDVLATLLAAALAALGISLGVVGQARPAAPLPASDAIAAHAAPALIERGRYLTALGDCVACHTQKGGVPFAGGRPLQTPFGIVLSANLTPDDDTGIGRYNADTLYRALHQGIDNQGRHLYAAFPYNYYTHITREDTEAIFAYLRSLAPVRHPLGRNRLPFPFDIRALMVVWNWMFLDTGPYQPDATRSAEWNRGAYLAEGLGHCQACHTPKNLLGGPKSGEAYRGGAFADLFAPDITPNRHVGIGAWRRDELLDFLRQGMNVHSAASAEMGEVVAFSTSQMNDADLAAMVVYLRGLPASPARDLQPPARETLRQGEAIWQDECSACHQMDGQGVPGTFPPLQGNPNLQQSDPSTVLHFILAGTRHVPTDHRPTPLAMPAFRWKLDDAQVAAVASYARNSWGNRASVVSAEQAREVREKLQQAEPASAR